MKKEQDPFGQLTIYEEIPVQPAWTKLVQPDGRVVWSPNEPMAIEQNAILEELNHLGIEFKYATAVPGSDFVNNALHHSGNRHFFSPNQVYNILSAYTMPPEGAGLVQGGSSSPLLFNIYCLDLDHELGDFCEQRGITYTRYLDDMTFSSPDSGFDTHSRIGKGTRRSIYAIIQGHNLKLNESKTKVRDLKNGPVKVTGLQINTGGKIQMPTSYLRHKRQELMAMVTSASQRAQRAFAPNARQDNDR
jgi:hypothetical protein